MIIKVCRKLDTCENGLYESPNTKLNIAKSFAIRFVDGFIDGMIIYYILDVIVIPIAKVLIRNK